MRAQYFVVRSSYFNFWNKYNLKSIWNKYKHLAIPIDARLASLKTFFILEQRNIYTCMVICPCDGTYNHLTYFKKNKSMRSEPQNIGLAFEVLTPKISCLIRFDYLILQTNVFKRVNSGKIILVVTCTADRTCHHLNFPAKNSNFRENWSIWNKYMHLAIPNDARLASLKAFFILEQRNIYTWLYVPVTGHITIWYILKKNKGMKSEPQNIGLAFDVLTPKLSCPIRFGHLIFQNKCCSTS